MEGVEEPGLSAAVSASLGGAATVALAPEPAADDPIDEAAAPIDDRRDRLLAGLTLIAGVALLLGLPFALKAGAEFFLPVTISLVIAIALIPILEWLERRRLPSWLASLICVISFLALANVALAAIIVPAIEFFRKLPERIDRIQTNLAPLLDLYQTLEKYLNRTITHLANAQPVKAAPTAAVAPPGSLLELAATSAPAAIVQVFFGVLVVFFFLAGWSRTRRNTITSRQSFGGAMATARVIQDVVDDVSAYLGTITMINVVLGAIVGTALWAIGMPYPAMWGGIVALLNYVPYFGPIVAALLLAIGGLMTFDDIWYALFPAFIMIGCHLLEANVVTPLIVGHRLTINPVMILISLSFWSWVWGTPGALLAVPLLIIIQTVVGAAGKPDIAGFLFERGTLVRERPKPRFSLRRN
ncbi:AI-2E family transporter [Sphingomonas panacisoli]|uniref:AI-2E family transporter n=1 Tax=Sphingomonas panacisoli TaxID=1813879 RepID=A0A5B8LFZ8_9SPHN|nr:AI-2E family transporter [Sphingomonas panacisoli]QDZ07178.1 AI-2E family transporter [Sphingomonas panacisoli]